MSPLQIKLYNPSGPSQAARIPQEEWSKHESRIRELHAARYTRKQVLEILEDECQKGSCSFKPS
jgi:hypothetical protein